MSYGYGIKQELVEMQDELNQQLEARAQIEAVWQKQEHDRAMQVKWPKLLLAALALAILGYLFTVLWMAQ